MTIEPSDRDLIEKLFRRERALADFGTFAFREGNLLAILNEAARVCAECLDVAYSKICRFRPDSGDLLIVAGSGWDSGVVGYAISLADETTPQGLAFSTGEPQVCPDIAQANTFTLPSFYRDHAIRSTVDVLVAARSGAPFGVLEADSQDPNAFSRHDIDFLTGFANVLAEAVATADRSAELRRTFRRMEELIEEKETLAQELKHRVRNSLHLVYGLLTAELDGDHPDTSIQAFRMIAVRVMGLAEVFDLLLGVGMNKVVNLGEYIGALCKILPDLYREEGIRLTVDTDMLLIGLDIAMALGVVVTELISNAYLHAFPDHAGEISVVLRATQGQASLSISDNGTGFDGEDTRRRGMSLVRRLVKQVGGDISLRSNRGSTWTIRFPPDDVPLAA